MVMVGATTTMGTLTLFFVMSAFCFLFAAARSANFDQDFKVTWSENHIQKYAGGKTIKLTLDQYSGGGFASKQKYLFGKISMKIKLIPGDSAGTVTAFYMNSDNDARRDELDFEFLGNRTGQPYTVQTNVWTDGKGNREQRVNLWFDPTLTFHRYSILWNHAHIVFYVDDMPIRVYKNSGRGILYPTRQAMGVYSTLWEADDWATRGGLEKIDWTRAPFSVFYTDFSIDGCDAAVMACTSNVRRNWWEGSAYSALNPKDARMYRWVRMNHMVYDYCTDGARFTAKPPECRV